MHEICENLRDGWIVLSRRLRALSAQNLRVDCGLSARSYGIAAVMSEPDAPHSARKNTRVDCGLSARTSEMVGLKFHASYAHLARKILRESASFRGIVVLMMFQVQRLL